MAVRPTTMTATGLHVGAMACLATIGLAATAASPASAAAPPAPKPAAFGLSPLRPAGALRLRGGPGRVTHGAVLVHNVSPRPITVILQTADIQNASNGNADFVTPRSGQTGRWLRLSATRVRLAAHAGRQVRFTITIPAAATGGSHYAGIVAINAADLAVPAVRKRTRGRTFTFFRVRRQALPVTIRLPGPLSRTLALRSTTLTPAAVGAGLTLGLLPGGGVLIEGAKMQLRVSRGARTIFTYAAPIGQLFPGSPLNYRIPWTGTPTAGT